MRHSKRKTNRDKGCAKREGIAKHRAIELGERGNHRSKDKN